MDILDSLRQAPSAELYRLYLTIGKMLDDPQRILEVRQRLHIGMTLRYIGDNPLGPPSEGTITELRHTQAVVQDNVTRRELMSIVVFARRGLIRRQAVAEPVCCRSPVVRL